MKCAKCGHEFFEGIFCPECGTKNEEIIVDEKAVAEAAERERKKAEEAAAEEAKKIVEAEKAAIKEKAEKEERERAIKIAQQEAKKSISSEDDDIKNEASKRIREEAIQKAKEEEEKRRQEEEAKKAKEEKVINRKAVISLVLGIASWVLVLTIFVPLITTCWSIVDGIKALKGKTKFKKLAIIGIILSGLWWAFIVWAIIDIYLFDSASRTTTNTSSVEVATEIVAETDIEVENDEEVETSIEKEITRVEEKDTEVGVNTETEASAETGLNIDTEINTEVKTYTEPEENIGAEREIEQEIENDEYVTLEIKTKETYENDIQFFTIQDFPYQNEKKASKLLKVYQKAKDAPETDFVNVESERKGIFDGSEQYIQTLSLGDYLYYGDMKKGKSNGEGVLFHSIESPAILGEFKDGQLNGYVICYNSSDGLGVTSEGYYSKGELDGDYTKYLNLLDYFSYKELKFVYEDYLSERRELEQDANSADILMFPVQIQEKGEYKNGKLAGKWINYYEDGAVKAEIKYDSNGKTSTGSVYYHDGTLKYKGELKGDSSNLLYHGKGTLYREDGSIEYKGEFENGKIKT